MNKVIVKALPKIDNAVLRDLFFKIGVQMVQTHQESFAKWLNGASETITFPEATLGGRVVDIYSGSSNGDPSTRQTDKFAVVATHTQNSATKETTCTMTLTNNSGSDFLYVVVNIISF